MLFAVSRVKASISELCQEPWSVIAWPNIDLALSKLLNPGDKSVERLNKLLSKMLSLNSGNSSTILSFLRFSSISDLFYPCIFFLRFVHLILMILCLHEELYAGLHLLVEPSKKLGLSSFDFVFHCLIYCIPESPAHLVARKKNTLGPIFESCRSSNWAWINQPTN